MCQLSKLKCSWSHHLLSIPESQFPHLENEKCDLRCNHHAELSRSKSEIKGQHSERNMHSAFVLGVFSAFFLK
jgi:hypothetical protein